MCQVFNVFRIQANTAALPCKYLRLESLVFSHACQNLFLVSLLFVVVKDLSNVLNYKLYT